MQSNQSLSSLIFSTLGKRKVQPHLYLSEVLISAAFIWTTTEFSGEMTTSGFSYIKMKNLIRANDFIDQKKAFISTLQRFIFLNNTVRRNLFKSMDNWHQNGF